MPAADHSAFPASAAKRLLACPGCYGLSLAVVGGARAASVFSAEGTLAHLLAETKLRTGMPWSYYAAKPYTVDGFPFVVAPDFIAAVSVYTEYVELLHAIGYETRLEQRVSPSWAFDTAPPVELFGTADCLAYDPAERQLVVVDLKFGKGVPVEVESNDQLLYYAAGALQHFPEAEHITLVVVQPRAAHPDGPIRPWQTTAKHVIGWAQDTLQPGVSKAFFDMGQTFNPGDHCQFCPALRECVAPRQMLAELTRREVAALGTGEDPLADPGQLDPLGDTSGVSTLTPEVVGELLDQAAVILPLIELARERAKEFLEAGTAVPGWEVKSRAGTRTWAASETEILSAINAAGEVMGRALVLRSPSQLQELFGDEFFKDRLQPFVASAPRTLVLQRSRKGD